MANLNVTYADMEAEGIAILKRDGARKDIVRARAADMRYVGKEHPVMVAELAEFTAYQRSFEGVH